MELIVLSSKSKDEFTKKLQKEMNNYNEKGSHKISIVIDGSTLTYALEDNKTS
jgi:23S rRNA pseudoU1915 N3-methylase RlmH